MPMNVPAVLQLAAGVVMWLLAPAMLYLDRRAEANRAFAAFLLVQGGVLLTGGMAIGADTVEAVRSWASVYPYVSVAVPFAVGYFVSVYPRRRSWIPEGVPAWAPFLAGALVLELVILGRPELYWALDAVTSEMAAGVAWPPRRAIGLMFWVGEASLVLAAILLTREVVHGGQGARRLAMAFVGMGLFAPTSCQCAGGEFLNRSLYEGWILLGAPHTADPFSQGAVVGVLHELLILLVVGLFLFELAYVAYYAFSSEDPELRRILRPFVGLVAVSTLILVAVFSPAVPEDLRITLWLSMYGLWWLIGTGLVAYAIARHSLFDLDLKVKWTLERGTVAAIFVAVFFVVGELAETFFAEVLGPYAGVFAAGGLVFFLAPLQRFANRVSDMAMPGTKEPSEMDAAERRELFRDQAELVWMDGQLTEKDRRVLENLRERLGIDAETANEIENEVLEA